MIESKVSGVVYEVDGEEVEWHAAFHLFEFDYDDRYRFWSGVAQIDAEMDQPANIQFRLEDGRVGGGDSCLVARFVMTGTARSPSPEIRCWQARRSVGITFNLELMNRVPPDCLRVFSFAAN